MLMKRSGLLEKKVADEEANAKAFNKDGNKQGEKI